MKGGAGWGLKIKNPVWWGGRSMDLFQNNTVKRGTMIPGKLCQKILNLI